MLGILILFVTSLPTSIEHGAALGGLIAAMIIIGIGTGGIKSNVSPLIAEQYRGTKMKIRVEKNGERVIVDPAVTVQRIYMSVLPLKARRTIKISGGLLIRKTQRPASDEIFREG